jgi:hypothetical protein
VCSNFGDWAILSARIADELNREGYHPPCGGERFSYHMIIKFLRRLSLHEASAGQKLLKCMLDIYEWAVWASVDHLRMPMITLYHWCRQGSIHHHKLPGTKGCMIVWADARKLKRVRSLREYRPISSPPPYPAESTTSGSQLRLDTNGCRSCCKEGLL